MRTFIGTSARTGEGIATLKTAIGEQLGQLRHIRDPVPESFFAVKRQLESLAAENDFVTNKEYAELCDANGVTDPDDQKHLLRFLHDLGNVLSYGDPQGSHHLGDTNILNPEWVTGGVYRILNDRELLQAVGALDRAAVRRILGSDPRYPENRHDFILGMMRKFELCFDLPGAADGRLLVPELLHPNQPITDWDAAQTLNFQYDYTVLPEGVLPRFITRMSHALTDPPTIWRSGVVLKVDGNGVMVRADTHGNRILVAVDGPAGGRRGALIAVRDYFKAIHASVSKLRVAEMVPMPDAPEILVGYQHLLTLEENGQSECWPEGAKRNYPVADLLNGIEDPERRKEERGRKREHDRPKIIAPQPPQDSARIQSPEGRENAAAYFMPIATVLIFIVAMVLIWILVQDIAVMAAIIFGAILLSYPIFLVTLRRAGYISQNNFRRLSLGILDKLPSVNPAKADPDD